MRLAKGNWVYIFLAFAIVFIVAKYLFVASPLVSSLMVSDLFILLLILIAIFIYHKYNLQSKVIIQNHNSEISLLKNDFETSRKKLIEMIDATENRSNQEKKDIVKVGIVTTEITKLSSLKDLNKRADKILSILATQFQINSGIIYKQSTILNSYNVIGTFAVNVNDVVPIGEGIGLHGQAILARETRVIDSIPEDYYCVYSGLGESKPTFLYFLPVISSDVVIGLIELSSFKRLKIDALWSELNVVIGNVLVKD